MDAEELKREPTCAGRLLSLQLDFLIGNAPVRTAPGIAARERAQTRLRYERKVT